MSSRAFTLLEVMLAIVLLTIIVLVCVPFLHINKASTLYADTARFHNSVHEAVYREQQTHSGELSTDDYQRIATSNGWELVIVEESSSSTQMSPKRGEWVAIRSGELESFHWAPTRESIP